MITISDNGNGIRNIKFENGFNVILDNNKPQDSTINNSNGQIIYRGVIQFEDESDLSTAYINLINYNSTSVYKVLVSQMQNIPDHAVTIQENATLAISSIDINTVIRIVEMPLYGVNDFDTNKVIIEKNIAIIPFHIILPKDSNVKDYIIWIGNSCVRISI